MQQVSFTPLAMTMSEAFRKLKNVTTLPLTHRSLIEALVALGLLKISPPDADAIVDCNGYPVLWMSLDGQAHSTESVLFMLDKLGYKVVRK